MRLTVACCPTHQRPVFPLLKGGTRKVIDRDRPAIRKLQKRMRVAVAAFLKQRGADIAAQVRAMSLKLAKDDADEIKRILASLDFDDWEKLIEELEPLLRKMLAEGASAAFAQIGIVDDVQRMLELVNEHGVEYAKKHGAELVTNITKATRQMLRGDIAEALKEGLSNDDLADMLVRNYAFSRERAELIARTETAYADVQGNLRAYQESGVVWGKQWITGDGCCDLCDELNGTVVALDEEFPNDGGDGPPLHPNCRCDVLPVLDAEHDVRRLEMAKAGGGWDDDKHPRDERGRFVSTGSAADHKRFAKAAPVTERSFYLYGSVGRQYVIADRQGFADREMRSAVRAVEAHADGVTTAAERATLARQWDKIAFPLERDSVLYRGISLSSKDRDTIVAAMKSGKQAQLRLSDKASLAVPTSIDHKVATKFSGGARLAIAVPKGERVLQVTAFANSYQNEKELALRPGATVRIIGIVRDRKGYSLQAIYVSRRTKKVETPDAEVIEKKSRRDRWVTVVNDDTLEILPGDSDE